MAHLSWHIKLTIIPTIINAHYNADHSVKTKSVCCQLFKFFIGFPSPYNDYKILSSVHPLLLIFSLISLPSTFSFAHSALEHPSSSSSSPLRVFELLFPLPGLLFLSDVCLAYKSPSSLCFHIISSLRSALATLSKIESLHSTLPIHPHPRLNFSPCVCHHQTYYWILSFILFSSFLSLEDKLQKGRKFCLFYAVSYPWCLENSWNIQNV